MTHWQDKGTCPQALPGTPRGSPSRPSRWRAHTRHLGAKDDDCSFRLFFEKGRRPSSSLIAASEAVPPGPTCKGTNPENPKAPFSPQAASPAPPRAPACKRKESPSHTPRSAARFSACCHPQFFCPAKQIFVFFCRHRSPRFSGTSTVVPTSDRDDSPKCRSCRHTNQHFTGTSRVVPTLVVTFLTLRVQTSHHNPAPMPSSHKPAFHRHSQGGRTRHSQHLARNHKTHSRKWKPASHRHFSPPPCRRNQHRTGTSVATKRPNITL
jgi:hypothetical protein